MTKLHYKTDEGFQEIDFVPESVSSESIHGDSLTIGEEITVGPSDMEHVEITQNSIETFYENRVLGSTITSIGGTEPITMTNRSGYSALSTTCYVDSNHIDEYGQIKVTYTVLKKDSTKITSETSKISIDLMGCSIESNTWEIIHSLNANSGLSDFSKKIQDDYGTPKYSAYRIKFTLGTKFSSSIVPAEESFIIKISKVQLVKWKSTYTSNIKIDGKDLLIGGNPVNDFIVAEGTSELWRWRKWNSGVAECWCVDTITVNSWTNYVGTWYYYAASISLPSNLFIEAPVSTVTVNTNGNGLFGACLRPGNTRETLCYYLISAAKEDGSLMWPQIRCIGRWK